MTGWWTLKTIAHPLYVIACKVWAKWQAPAPCAGIEQGKARGGALVVVSSHPA